jgi:sugar diacid utilization regulator
MQAALSEMLVASIGEYTEETRRVARGRGERRTEQVEKALSGQPVDPAVLGYDLATTHIGVIAKSENADDLLADIASRLELQLLSLSRSEDTVWAWLGNKGGFAEHGVHDLLSREAAGGDIIGVGEPADGPGGFRQTHRQAQSSYQLALRLESATMKQSVTRYKDVALLALALQDDAVAESLVDLYIGPLSDARDRGKALKDTLRAYFATGQNAASAAAKLGVHERTVSYRLRAIEEHLGHAVNERRAELEVALKLEELLA